MSARVIKFEVGDLASAARLACRLASAWEVTVQEQREINFVVARLRSRPYDLAVVLREVEAWIAHEPVATVRYELDGREYML